MKIAADLGKISVGSKTGIDPGVISCIVTVCIGFKDRREVDGIRTELFDMRDPVIDF